MGYCESGIYTRFRWYLSSIRTSTNIKVTKCTITDSSKKCAQKKSAKALYDCPAAKSGQTPLRLNDGTETFGYASVCGDKDLECQIQKCGRNPDSTNCLESSMLA